MGRQERHNITQGAEANITEMGNQALTQVGVQAYQAVGLLLVAEALCQVAEAIEEAGRHDR